MTKQTGQTTTTHDLWCEIIGVFMQTPTGTIGRVSGINMDTGMARLALSNGRYIDVPQGTLTRPSKF
jgi:hypothetical protein